MDTAKFLEERGYLTIGSLVTYLGQYHPTKAVSYPTLKRFIDKGYFAYVKVGGQYRLTKESIDFYVKHGTDPVPESSEGEEAQMPPTPPPQAPEPESEPDEQIHIPIVE